MDATPEQFPRLPPLGEPEPTAAVRGEPPARPERARLTCTGQLVYEAPQGEPFAAETAWSRDLATDEQVYHRSAKATGEWAPLPAGWIKDLGRCSQLVLRNDAGRRLGRRPGPEERAALERQVLEVGLVVDERQGSRTMHSPPRTGPQAFALVRPFGLDGRFEPAALGRLVVRSADGSEVPYSLTLFPG